MESFIRLQMLSEQMDLEPAEDTTSRQRPQTPPGCFTPKQKDAFFVHPAQLPNGKTIKLLKTLLTSACERDCFYCPFRAGRDFRRATFKPEEFASVFMELHRRGIAEGTFLSSGITGGGMRTQDKLLDTAEILRRKLNFQGYIHLKIMPGAERAQVEHAMQLADRVSVNLEAPNTNRLAALAPHKQFLEELLQPLKGHEDLQHLIRFSKGYYTAEYWGDTLVFNDLRFGQIIGWQDPGEKFVFHFFIRQPAANRLVVQRGRFAKWNWEIVKSMVRRIRGR